MDPIGINGHKKESQTCILAEGRPLSGLFTHRAKRGRLIFQQSGNARLWSWVRFLPFFKDVIRPGANTTLHRERALPGSRPCSALALPQSR